MVEFDTQYLHSELQRFPDTNHWVVGLSGGMDSVVLLHALLATKPSQTVSAIHVNHGLSPNADKWQNHCEALCRDWGVPLVVKKASVANEGRGLEDAARQVRYELMADEVVQGAVLLLAHHQDDQAETLLFRLMRGAGPYGLSAMSDLRAFASGYIGRPLLRVPKTALRDYAEHHQLVWVEDESNRDEQFDRNFLRNSVMPLLESRWPNFAQRWQRTATACEQSDQMAHDLSLMDLERCDEQRERWGYSLCHASLSTLPRYRRNNLLRNWVRARGFSIMEFKHLDEVDKQFFDEPTSGAVVQWGDSALRLFSDRLFLTSSVDLSEMPAVESLPWDGMSPLILPDGSLLKARVSPMGKGLKPAKSSYTIRWREGGERCRPAERNRSQTLKKLLQEYGVEPWLRDRTPLIYHDQALVAVGDLWVCKGYENEPGEPALEIEWVVEN